MEGMPVILIALNRILHIWYSDLIRFLANYPWALPSCPDLLFQVTIYHPASRSLVLMDQVLMDRGITDSVIPIKVRKSTPRIVYHCAGKCISHSQKQGISIPGTTAWDKFCLFPSLVRFNIWPCVPSRALAFLFQRLLASHSLVKAFLLCVTHIVPPVCSPTQRDLRLVLLFNWKSPFEPTSDFLLYAFNHEVAFPISITSLRQVGSLNL